MAASLHVQFYLDKLMSIDKELGGTAAACIIYLYFFIEKKAGDDFTSLKDSIHTLLF